ncbi:MAG: hypothetical protein RL136_313 [Planctomycetota bacterium]
MPSVVIPAHNESSGIARTLRSVLAERIDGLTVVVVANACSDDTAERARAFGAGVIVVETAKGGKTNALNLGERELRERGLDHYPRLFLDGDIELTPGTLARLFEAASGVGARVVAARPCFVTEGCSAIVRLYYGAERFNPYHSSGAPNGSGTYCVNREGRTRWDEFPEVLADDGFVERQFAADERATLGVREDAGFAEASEGIALVRVPRTIGALRRMSARVRLGTAELDRVAPLRADQRAAGGTFGAVFRALAPNPLMWPELVVWTAFKLLERLESRGVARKQGTDRWQQDRTSRS